jgi:arabinogalactan endo-1,4-beta-galactosidase
VNPRNYQNQGPAYDLSYTLKLASRFQAKGYRIYLDYHFSDTWADPQKQYIPKAWPTEVNALAKHLRNHVSSTLGAFRAAGINVSLVSLGNELRNGMLWPTGKVNPSRAGDFANLSRLYRGARDGISDAVGAGLRAPLVMIHIDNGWDRDLQLRWFAGLTASRVVSTADWDVVGLSFYPFYSTKATFGNLASSMSALAAKYAKPIMVAETDYPAQCQGKYKPKPAFREPSIAIGVKGQVDWTKRLISTVKKVPNGLGQGVFYWEPAWTNNTSLGSACEDAILFKSDWSKWPKTMAYSRESVNLFK